MMMNAVGFDEAEQAVRGVFDLSAKIDCEGLVYGEAWEDGDIIAAMEEKGGTVDDEFVCRFFDSLPNFTPQGLRRILPQYLLFALRYPQSDAAERLMYRIAAIASDVDYISVYNKLELSAIKRVFSALLSVLIDGFAPEIKMRMLYASDNLG